MPQEEQEDIGKVIKEVLENDPLYVKVKVAKPSRLSDGLYSVGTLFLRCPQCKQKYPFHTMHSSGGGAGSGMRSAPPPKRTVDSFAYTCTGCQSITFRYWVEVDREEGWLRKVGQLPSWDIGISHDVERFLGEDAEFYKRARICMSQSYGLAACAYLRRVLENQINGLLILIRDTHLEEGSQEKGEKINELLHSKSLDDKLSKAYCYAPGVIIVEGSNPLKLIYENLSAGIHRRSEEECICSALEVSAALEFVVLELARHREMRKQYTERIRELSQRRSLRIS
jgi:hypothetical protein